MARLTALARLITRRRVWLAGVEFTEATGEVCHAACRSAARLERAHAAAAAARLGYRN
jgi:hypothetical protein